MTSIRSFLIPITALSCCVSFADDKTKLPASNPCSGDIQKYCSDVTPGEGRLARCMKKHASELSAGCKEFGKKYKKEHPDINKELSAPDKH